MPGLGAHDMERCGKQEAEISFPVNIAVLTSEVRFLNGADQSEQRERQPCSTFSRG